MSLATPLSLGQRLIRERLRLHWSQEEVAQVLGTTARSVNRWEHDKAVPHPHYRQHLCQIFQVSSESLFGPFPSMKNAPSAPSSLWNLPYRRNPFFTGREAILLKLHTLLHSGKTTTLTQAQAMSGLGGIGKTQTVIEYTYRYYDHYSAVFWVRAETHALIVADFVAIAAHLSLSEKDEQDQTRTVEAVKQWLNTSTHWLLILDNVEDFTVLQDFLPQEDKGSIIITTRSQSTGVFAQCITLEQMHPDEGAAFLLRRSKIIEESVPQESIPEKLYDDAQALAHVLDGLPLALDQAGAYIEETGCSLLEYNNRYQARQITLLDRRGTTNADHPHSVSTTFSLCLEKVEHVSPLAAEVLRLCAFLSPEAIPEEILIEGSLELGPLFQTVATDPLALGDALAVLGQYSLLHRNSETKMLSLHRLVQVVCKERINEQMQRCWAERVISAINCTFPHAEETTVWSRCQRLLPQVEVCTQLIDQWSIASSVAGHLLNEAGVYLRERALYTQAEVLLSQACGVREHAMGPEHPDVAHSLDDLASLYWCQGKYSEAESLYRRALMIKEQQLGPQHLDTAETLNNLAVLSFHQGWYSEAESLYRRALTIKEQQLGMEHSKTADTLNNLAVLYRNQGRYSEAEPLYLRTLAIWEQQLGPQHPDTVFALGNLGRLYCLQARYEKAEPYLQQALLISEVHFGPEHPHTAQSLSNVARLYVDQGRYSEAESLFQRALTIREQHLGKQHPYTALTLNSLAMLSSTQGKDMEAIVFFERALDIRERQLGPEHPDVANSLNDLAGVYVKQGRYEQAESLFQRALAIREHKLGTEHPDTIITRENYANLLRKMKWEEEC